MITCQYRFIGCNKCPILVWGVIDNGEKLSMCEGKGGGKSLPSFQFCWEPEAALTNSLSENLT